MPEEFETAAKFLLETEAELARLALAERGIEARVVGRPLFGTGVLSLGGKDAFRLEVPSESLDEARDILRGIDGGGSRLPEETEPAE